MGSITANVMLTANGVAEAPETWQFAYFSPELAGLMLEQLGRSAGIVLGHRTYDEFVGYWPNVTGADNPMAPAINALPKYVVSHQPVTLDWSPAESVHGDVAGATRRTELDLVHSDVLPHGVLHLEYQPAAKPT